MRTFCRSVAWSLLWGLGGCTASHAPAESDVGPEPLAPEEYPPVTIPVPLLPEPVAPDDCGSFDLHVAIDSEGDLESYEHATVGVLEADSGFLVSTGQVPPTSETREQLLSYRFVDGAGSARPAHRTTDSERFFRIGVSILSLPDNRFVRVAGDEVRIQLLTKFGESTGAPYEVPVPPANFGYLVGAAIRNDHVVFARQYYHAGGSHHRVAIPFTIGSDGDVGYGALATDSISGHNASAALLTERGGVLFGGSREDAFLESSAAEALDPSVHLQSGHVDEMSQIVYGVAPDGYFDGEYPRDMRLVRVDSHSETEPQHGAYYHPVTELGVVSLEHRPAWFSTERTSYLVNGTSAHPVETPEAPLSLDLRFSDAPFLAVAATYSEQLDGVVVARLYDDHVALRCALLPQ